MVVPNWEWKNIGQNPNGGKNIRKFIEKESWKKDFMCGQTGYDWNGFI